MVLSFACEAVVLMVDLFTVGLATTTGLATVGLVATGLVTAGFMAVGLVSTIFETAGGF